MVLRRTLHHHHAWDVSPQQARDIQNELKGLVDCRDRMSNPINRVAGVDVGFEQDGAITRAAVAVLDFPRLELLEYSVARKKTTFPYIPGLLSFREIPAILDAIDGLSIQPDVFICDGQGYAHPRRFGLACHLGLMTDIPSIGVGKTRLIGDFGKIPKRRGAWTALMHRNEVIGAVLRSREAVQPIYVSIGHRVSLETAVKLVMACTTRFKLPETTRWAHRFASG